MIRRIIEINEDKCNGCGICAKACHEGAIGMVNGKATLLRDDYCDGLGDCLPTCPTNAISFVKREAAAYDEKAVKARMKQKFSGCPGSQMRSFNCSEMNFTDTPEIPSQLMQWPCQIKLAPVNAPYFDNCSLLIAADCSAFAYANMHNRFIKGNIALIGCPKLDSIDYSEKLSQIIALNNIKSVTIVRMEVPCCGGLNTAVKKAISFSGKNIPLDVYTISTDGRILN